MLAGTWTICIASERACPPENCGGICGYEEFLAALADPDEDDELLEWVGGEFDPGRFDLAGVNPALTPARGPRTPSRPLNAIPGQNTHLGYSGFAPEAPRVRAGCASKNSPHPSPNGSVPGTTTRAVGLAQNRR
jgi:Plasmid pRiA4b ORF-3-like protein